MPQGLQTTNRLAPKRRCQIKDCEHFVGKKAIDFRPKREDYWERDHPGKMCPWVCFKHHKELAEGKSLEIADKLKAKCGVDFIKYNPEAKQTKNKKGKGSKTVYHIQEAADPEAGAVHVAEDDDTHSVAESHQSQLEEVNSRLNRLEQQRQQTQELSTNADPASIPKLLPPAHAYLPSVWAANGYNLQGLGDEFGALTHEQASHLHKNASTTLHPPPSPITGSPPKAAHSAPSKLLEDHRGPNEQGHIIYDHTGKPFDRRW